MIWKSAASPFFRQRQRFFSYKYYWLGLPRRTLGTKLEGECDISPRPARAAGWLQMIDHPLPEPWRQGFTTPFSTLDLRAGTCPMQSSATVRIRDCTVGGMWLFRIRMSSRNERVDSVCQPAGAGHVDFERKKKA